MAIKEAIGKFPLGEKKIVQVIDKKTKKEVTKFRYDVRCEDCGKIIGFIDYKIEMSFYDPAKSGLICGDCAKERIKLIKGNK